MSTNKEKLKCISKEQLGQILARHQEWLEQGVGVRADFSKMDLSGVSFAGMDLTEAFFNDANLKGADFSGCILRSTDFTGANLVKAKFCNAFMRWATLRGANAKEANFFEADLFHATMTGADLRGALLRHSLLRMADLRKIILDEDDAIVRKNWGYTDLNCATIDDRDLSKIVPDYCLQGRIIGYKKVKGIGEGADGTQLIAKLEIPADARRVNSTSRQCRCDKAKVLSITYLDGKPFAPGEAVGWFFPTITYRVGEMATEPRLSEDKRNTQTKGIHFFLTRKEAVKFGQKSQ